MSREVEVDMKADHWSTVATELPMELGEALDEISTRSNRGDRLGRQVRISGTLIVEDIGPGLKERCRQRRKEKREEAIQRHAVAEGAEAATAGEAGQ